MRDRYYADNRDLIKWGVLLRLAERYSAGRILQVAYFRPTAWPCLRIDDDICTIPDNVIAHFRCCRNIEKIINREERQLRIEVISSPFSDRPKYLKEILTRIEGWANGLSIIFLDPDTGLAPRRPGPEHVLNNEIIAIWNAMSGSDVLVMYQHQTNRRGEPWIDTKRSQMEEVLKLPPGTVKVAIGEDPDGKVTGTTVPKDVALFFCPESLPAGPRLGLGDNIDSHITALSKRISSI